jgi:hypothetical protein
MISFRKFSLLFLLPVGLLATSLDSLPGGIDQPAVSRGKLPLEQPAPVKPADHLMEPPASVGVQEVSRPDGGGDVIYYSVTPAEEKQARHEAESHKQEKSLELLNSAIIIKKR